MGQRLATCPPPTQQRARCSLTTTQPRSPGSGHSADQATQAAPRNLGSFLLNRRVSDGREGGHQAADGTSLRRPLLSSWTPQHSPMMLGLVARLRSHVQALAAMPRVCLWDRQPGDTGQQAPHMDTGATDTLGWDSPAVRGWEQTGS